MKLFKLAIGSPVYEEVYQYSTKTTKKLIKEECRKHLILRFTAKVFGKEYSEETFMQAISDLSEKLGNTEVVDLSSVSWGEASYYDEETETFYGAMCVAKDFDNMDEQKALVGQICREYEKKLNNMFRIVTPW